MNRPTRGRLAALAAIAVLSPLSPVAADWIDLYDDVPPLTGTGGDSVFKEISDNLPPLANDPVVTSVGEFITEEVDLDLGGPIRLGFARQYGNNLAGSIASVGFHPFTGSPMGGSWTHNFNLLLRRFSDTQVAILFERGRLILFQKSDGWEMVQPFSGFLYKGIPFQLVESGSKLELMDPRTSRIHTFEFASLADGDVSKVERIRDRNGNTLTMSYGPGQELLEVADGLGRSLTFENTVVSAHYRITGVTDQSGRSTSYAYTFPTLASATDGRGGVTQYQSATNFRITSITAPEGNVVLENTYDGGLVIQQSDGEGNAHTYAYGDSTTSITDPLGHTRTHGFDDELRLISFADEVGNTIDCVYDGSHRLASSTDRLGSTRAITYHEPSGSVASRTDNLGHTWSYGYESQEQEGFTFHEPNRIDFPDGTSMTMTLDDRGNVVSRTDRAGNTTTYTRNDRGQIETMTNAEGGVTTHAYNADGTVASIQSPSGDVTTYAYDAAKRVISIQHPDATSVAYTYDANDNVTSITDENGHTTSFAYDANDNLLSTTDPLGHVTTYTYDGNDDRVSMTDPLGRSTTFSYDGLRRVASVTDPGGGTTVFTYDARRRLVSITDPLGRTWLRTYDDEGVLASFTDPLGQTTQVLTDAVGRPIRLLDPLGNEIELDHDPLGRLIAIVDPLGEVHGILRDGNGEIVGVELAEPGMDASYVRDGLRRIASATDPRGNQWLADHDPDGRRVSRTDPLGNQTAFAYDDRDRIESVVLPGAMGTIDVTYDAERKPVAWSASDGTAFGYAYDADDRLIAADGSSFAYSDDDEIIDSNGLDLTWDEDGRLATITFGPGQTVTYAYDARDHLATVTDWLGGVTTVTHDDEGRLASIEHANGTVTTYTYDAADRLLGVAEEDLTAGVISSIVLSRDADGRIVQATRETPLLAGPEVGLVELGHDAGNQVEGDPHDAMGRLLDDGERTYVWNLADHLVSYAADGSTVSFTRDAFGNVLTRADDDETREYVWNYGLGYPSIATERVDGVPVRHHVHTPGGRLLYSLVSSGAAGGQEATHAARSSGVDLDRLVYHYDEMGSTIFVTDDAGTIVQRFAYDPYGRILEEQGVVDVPFRFHGMYGVVHEVGLYSMRARYYDPDRARFLSRDPIELTDPVNLNPYQALFQNPLAYLDPEGTTPCDRPGCKPSLTHSAYHCPSNPYRPELPRPRSPRPTDGMTRKERALYAEGQKEFLNEGYRARAVIASVFMPFWSSCSEDDDEGHDDDHEHFSRCRCPGWWGLDAAPTWRDIANVRRNAVGLMENLALPGVARFVWNAGFSIAWHRLKNPAKPEPPADPELPTPPAEAGPHNHRDSEHDPDLQRDSFGDGIEERVL